MRVGLLTQWFDPEPEPATLRGMLPRGLLDGGHHVQVLTGFPKYPTGNVHHSYALSRRRDEIVEGVLIRRVALYPSHDSSVVHRALNYSSLAVSALVSGLDVFRDIDVLWVNYSPVTIGLPKFAQVPEEWTDQLAGRGVLTADLITDSEHNDLANHLCVSAG